MKTKNFIVIFIAVTCVALAVFLGIQRTTSNPSTTPSLKNLKPTITSTSTSTKEIVIVAFGDSLTAGYGVPIEDSYPMIVQERLNKANIPARVINMGVSGETTQGALERTAFILNQDPDIILLGLGANDMLRTLPVSDTKKNLTSIIETFKKENKPIILMGMQSVVTNGPVYKKEFDALYGNFAKQYSLPSVPFFLEGVAQRKELNTSDGIHPNRQGYEKIVDENIMPILIPFIKNNFK